MQYSGSSSDPSSIKSIPRQRGSEIRFLTMAQPTPSILDAIEDKGGLPRLFTHDTDIPPDLEMKSSIGKSAKRTQPIVVAIHVPPHVWTDKCKDVLRRLDPPARQRLVDEKVAQTNQMAWVSGETSTVCEVEKLLLHPVEQALAAAGRQYSLQSRAGLPDPAPFEARCVSEVSTQSSTFRAEMVRGRCRLVDLRARTDKGYSKRYLGFS
ncbi:hypothetical protein ACHAQA_004058 [Verticillium albo-atrum]